MNRKTPPQSGYLKLRNSIFLIVGSVLCVSFFFMLPRSVVENQEMVKNPSLIENIEVNPHDMPSDGAFREVIQSTRLMYSKLSEGKESAVLADSLADLYEKTGKFDSAAWFAEKAALFFNNPESNNKAGNLFYKAYTLTLNPEKREDTAEKVRFFFNKELEEDAENTNSKAKIAMTYLSSQNPMQGIMMLREIIEKDPENETALFNLGMLSVQSGQYEKAVMRLEKLVSLHADHTQARLLLGISYLNTGRKKEAEEAFQKVKQMDKNPATQATVDSYLNDLK